MLKPAEQLAGDDLGVVIGLDGGRDGIERLPSGLACAVQLGLGRVGLGETGVGLDPQAGGIALGRGDQGRVLVEVRGEFPGGLHRCVLSGPAAGFGEELLEQAGLLRESPRRSVAHRNTPIGRDPGRGGGSTVAAGACSGTPDGGGSSSRRKSSERNWARS